MSNTGLYSPTDCDVWMCEDADGSDYICTHVDDFVIVVCNPSHWLDLIKSTFLAGEI